MAVNYGPRKLRVPVGFQDVLEGLAREILREQPGNIVRFSAQYFKHKIELKQDNDSMGNIFNKQHVDSHSRDNQVFEEIPHPPKAKESAPQASANEEHAAVKIQAGFRGHKARRQVKELRESKSQVDKDKQQSHHFNEDTAMDDKINEEKAAVKIQAGYRGFKTRKELQQSKSEQSAQSDQIDENEQRAATKIQAGYRGYKTRKDIRGKRAGNQDNTQDATVDLPEHMSSDEEMNKAATKIQANFRGHKARKNKHADQVDPSSKSTDLENAKYDDDDDKRNIAATKIQAGYRGHKTRNEIQNKKQATALQEEERAATKIQAGFRGYQTRKELNNRSPKPTDYDASENQSTNHLNEEQAATRIQAGYRGYKTRREMQTRPQADNGVLDNNMDQSNLEEEKAAARIQAGFRGYKTRQELRSKRSMPSTDDFVTEEDREKMRAATKIQAGYRGHRTRKELHSRQTKEQDPLQATEVETHKETDINIPSEQDVAATKIQARYRGYRTRKQYQSTETHHDNQPSELTSHLPTEDNTDHENVEIAATKIQAGYRGYRARQEVKQMRNQDYDTY